MGKRDEVTTPKASSNWLALQKKLPPAAPSSKFGHARKKRKVEHASASLEITVGRSTTTVEEIDFIRGPRQPVASTSTSIISSAYTGPASKNGESILALRKMIAGELEYSESQRQPGKYLALDCEMVGVGIDGKESSLARVSLVNYYGAIQVDEFVRQRERVVDYRTEFSGVRPSDMVKAKPFAEVQQKVAELLKDRILVGHAVYNDLKALLLSHPRHLTRDTQVYAGKHKLMKSRRPALRMLVKQEVDVTIQSGEHSSVTDARATMAIYRLHRKEWDKGVFIPPLPHSGVPSNLSSPLSPSKKRKADTLHSIEADETERDDEADDDAKAVQMKIKKRAQGNLPGGGRKGVSSGLSTIISRRGDGPSSSAGSKGGGKVMKMENKKTEWWTELNGPSGGSKGSMSLRFG